MEKNKFIVAIAKEEYVALKQEINKALVLAACHKALAAIPEVNELKSGVPDITPIPRKEGINPATPSIKQQLQETWELVHKATNQLHSIMEQLYGEEKEI